jgi:hypothetical protein
MGLQLLGWLGFRADDVWGANVEMRADALRPSCSVLYQITIANTIALHRCGMLCCAAVLPAWPGARRCVGRQRRDAHRCTAIIVPCPYHLNNTLLGVAVFCSCSAGLAWSRMINGAPTLT